MTKLKVTVVAGARPNFIKVAPILKAFQKAEIDFRLVHTGQHYDKNLSDTFFSDLNIPPPHINFNVGSGSQAEQTGAIMIAFEKELINNPTDYVLVVGDVNSTVACGITTKKQNVRLIHVEAGLRSGDMTMPEEINRLVVDRISDLLFTTTQQASYTLKAEGVEKGKIHLVGNVMIDSLIDSLPKVSRPQGIDINKPFFVLTLHRPSNVDEKNKILNTLKHISNQVGQKASIIFPVHPRTSTVLNNFPIPENLQMVAPLRYLEFIYLIKNSIGVITDSGGIQEETTYLGVPCITLRENTERPETIHLGTNKLIGNDFQKLGSCIKEILENRWKSGSIPEFWDGKSAERIAEKIKA
ncbi:MAG: UDP-N-acetylglucosamine 2-epimerase (non-hydrolyzing) [Bacteroidota bacterium]